MSTHSPAAHTSYGHGQRVRWGRRTSSHQLASTTGALDSSPPAPNDLNYYVITLARAVAFWPPSPHSSTCHSPTMASSSSSKPDLGIYSQGQDSAVYLHDYAESSQNHQPHGHGSPAFAPPQDPEDTVTLDEDDDDNDSDDSGFDSGTLLGDETDTLASSILNHRMENGRQYHAYRDGSYWGPNDELAKEILDFAHHMYLLTLDQKLHLAPIENPHTILDVGTGTGIWAIVSLDHPS